MAKFPYRQSNVKKLIYFENQLQDQCKLAKLNYNENLVKNFGSNPRTLYTHLSGCTYSDQVIVTLEHYTFTYGMYLF